MRCFGIFDGDFRQLAALQRHCSLKGSLFSYHLDFLQRPVHMPTDPEALAEFEERRLKADRRALGEARNMAVVLHAAVETPAALREAALLKTIVAGMELDAQLELALSFTALVSLDDHC